MTKFERIFRLAKEIMRKEKITAKPAILKAVDEDDRIFSGKHPKKDFFAGIRNIKEIIKKSRKSI